MRPLSSFPACLQRLGANVVAGGRKEGKESLNVCKVARRRKWRNLMRKKREERKEGRRCRVCVRRAKGAIRLNRREA